MDTIVINSLYSAYLFVNGMTVKPKATMSVDISSFSKTDFEILKKLVDIKRIWIDEESLSYINSIINHIDIGDDTNIPIDPSLINHKEDITNKTDIIKNGSSLLYPSTKAVKDYIESTNKTIIDFINNREVLDRSIALNKIVTFSSGVSTVKDPSGILALEEHISNLYSYIQQLKGSMLTDDVTSLSNLSSKLDRYKNEITNSYESDIDDVEARTIRVVNDNKKEVDFNLSLINGSISLINNDIVNNGSRITVLESRLQELVGSLDESINDSAGSLLISINKLRKDVDEELEKKASLEYLNSFFVKSDNLPLTELHSGETISNKMKIWVGLVQSNETNGFFTVNYSSANFTSIPYVFVTALSKNEVTDTSANNANWSCIIKNSITRTSARGRAKNADTAGLLAAMVSVNSDCLVQVLAIGY